jgi:hypothetical protein
MGSASPISGRILAPSLLCIFAEFDTATWSRPASERRPASPAKNGHKPWVRIHTEKSEPGVVAPVANVRSGVSMLLAGAAAC